MNVIQDEEIIKRDKLLLDLMLHAYDEDNNRNELIDSKNSQMIIFTGAILTLQATLLSNILVEYIILSNISFFSKLLATAVLLFSFLLYLISIYYFMKAYVFSDKFQTSPTPGCLVDYAKEDMSLFDVQATVLATIGDTIKDNREVVKGKLSDGEKGFKWLKRAGLSLFYFLTKDITETGFHESTSANVIP